MKVVAETLGAGRSNLVLRRNGGKERKAYARAGGGSLLPAMRAIVEERPTSGYRRVGLADQ